MGREKRGRQWGTIERKTQRQSERQQSEASSTRRCLHLAQSERAVHLIAQAMMTNALLCVGALAVWFWRSGWVVIARDCAMVTHLLRTG